MRRPVSTQSQANGSQRPNGHMPPTDLPTPRNRAQIELQTVVTTSSNHFEPKVTTALLSNPKVNVSNDVTVVEINNEKESHKTMSHEGSSLVLDSSLNCEECCRCSCGETVSSNDDSTLEDIIENQLENCAKEKATISTQTSLSSTIQNQTV